MGIVHKEALIDGVISEYENFSGGYMPVNKVTITLEDKGGINRKIHFPTFTGDVAVNQVIARICKPVPHHSYIPLISYQDGFFVFETMDGKCVPLTLLILHCLTQNI